VPSNEINHNNHSRIGPTEAASPAPSSSPDWSSRTSAEVITPSEFLVRKERAGLHVVGIVGFSGQWSEEKLSQDPELRERVRFAEAELEGILLGLRERHGDKLVISSSATLEGVPKLAYELCADLGITAMGVACSRAADYKLGEMRYLIVEGSNWGDKSPTFLKTFDELIMLGGGNQAKREAITAANEGKPVLVIQGFGGTADDLRGNIVPALGRADTLEAQMEEGRINATFHNCGPLPRPKDLE
jgi:hypothetical protein